MPKPKIAVVGSRGISDSESIHLAMQKVLKCMGRFVLVSGGARGVDLIAKDWGMEHGIEVMEYLPEYEAYGRRAPLVRNQLIAETCDYMLAFWDGKSTGTMHVVAWAKALGKPVEVFTKAGPSSNWLERMAAEEP